jgi:uncharacterized protein (TIGR02611 family)
MKSKVHIPKDFQPILQLAWKLVIFVLGMSILIFGIVLFFTPGPAILVIPIGLTILATQFIWARKLLKQLKKGIHEMKEMLPSSKGTKPRRPRKR